MTDRIYVNTTSPSTTFVLEADVVDLGTIWGYLRAVNTGNTTSRYNDAGWQGFLVDGWGEVARVSGHPFLPSGYANGQQRYRGGPYGIYVGDPAGGVNIRTTLSFGHTAIAFMPIQPQAPAMIGFSMIGATTARVQFSGRGNGGSGITYWHLQLATSPGFEAASMVAYVESSGTTDFTNLIPGKRYYARARGGNAVGAGWWSATASAETLSGARVWTGGSYKQAIAYVWTGTGWRRAVPYVYSAGVWKIPR